MQCRIKGVRGTCPPPPSGSKFLHFYALVRKNGHWYVGDSLRGWHPALEDRGSATAIGLFFIFWLHHSFRLWLKEKVSWYVLERKCNRKSFVRYISAQAISHGPCVMEAVVHPSDTSMFIHVVSLLAPSRDKCTGSVKDAAYFWNYGYHAYAHCMQLVPDIWLTVTAAHRMQLVPDIWLTVHHRNLDSTRFQSNVIVAYW